MKKIGILGTYNKNNERPFLSTQSFVNNYIDRVSEAGAIPVGILFSKNNFSEKFLDDLDGIIIPGGSHVTLTHVLLIHYAFIHKKALLGICLGLQAIGIYDFVAQKILNDNLEVNYENLKKYFNEEIENECLIKVEDHNKEPEFYNDSIPNSKHEVFIENGTKLFDIYKKNTMQFVSVHNYVIKSISDRFIVSAKSTEGYIEGVEYDGDLPIIGTQFHPEIENESSIIFEHFINNLKEK